MNRRYSRARFVVTAGFFAVGFLLLVTRFAWVQVVRSEHWRERAAVPGARPAMSSDWRSCSISRPTP